MIEGTRPYFMTKYRLPGYRGGPNSLIEVNGVARRNILHALTFHAVSPSRLDYYIEEVLPAEDSLQSLNPLRRAYLSFTVYSIKQMVVAGIVNADTAWSLFYGEWGKIERVEEGTFKGMREAFYRDLHLVRQPDEPPPPDLLQFELLARAGQAGQAEYGRYTVWAQQLTFDTESCKNMSEAVKDEYRKALWLEMRLIESRVGMKKINVRDVDAFDFSTSEPRHCGSKTTACISLFESFSTVDSIIKAEIGHWMFSLFHVVPYVSELMDRMNCVGYTSAVGGNSNDSPEKRAFYEGGYGISSRGESFPSYPEVFSIGMFGTEAHEVAERIEKNIRLALIRAVSKKIVKREEIYLWYRKLGVYIVLLNLEGKRIAEIEDKIESLNDATVKEVEDYFTNREKKLRSIAQDPQQEAYHRIRCADALGAMGSASALSTMETMVVDSTQDIHVRSSIIAALGKIGADSSRLILEGILADPKEPSTVRVAAAMALEKINFSLSQPVFEGRLADQNEKWHIKRLVIEILGQAGAASTVPALERIFADYRDDSVFGSSSLRTSTAIALGSIASDASRIVLEGVLADTKQDSQTRVAVVKALGKIGSALSHPTLKKVLSDDHDFYVRDEAKHALHEINMKMIAKTKGDDDQFLSLMRQLYPQSGKNLGSSK
ncbi:MAG: HEAT repeat domain-containing protein [bacterium]